jgi:hypothetical protein
MVVQMKPFALAGWGSIVKFLILHYTLKITLCQAAVILIKKLALFFTVCYLRKIIVITEGGQKFASK